MVPAGSPRGVKILERSGIAVDMAAYKRDYSWIFKLAVAVVAGVLVFNFVSNHQAQPKPATEPPQDLHSKGIVPATTQPALAPKAPTPDRKQAGADAALKFHQEKADAGDAYGQYKMGLRYLKGDGVEKDEYKAKVYLGKAAAQGNQDAIEALKHMSTGH